MSLSGTNDAAVGSTVAANSAPVAEGYASDGATPLRSASADGAADGAADGSTLS